MATIIVSFASEQEAEQAVNRLANAGVGEVRARVLDSSEPLSFPKTDSTAPMIGPELGSIAVRASETPEEPNAMHQGDAGDDSGVIPTTGSSQQGVQVMIEVDDDSEDKVRRLLGIEQT